LREQRAFFDRLARLRHAFDGGGNDRSRPDAGGLGNADNANAPSDPASAPAEAGSRGPRHAPANAYEAFILEIQALRNPSTGPNGGRGPGRRPGAGEANEADADDEGEEDARRTQVRVTVLDPNGNETEDRPDGSSSNSGGGVSSFVCGVALGSFLGILSLLWITSPSFSRPLKAGIVAGVFFNLYASSWAQSESTQNGTRGGAKDRSGTRTGNGGLDPAGGISGNIGGGFFPESGGDLNPQDFVPLG
jgi:hypothetical protein